MKHNPILWAGDVNRSLTKESLMALMLNQIPFICIPNFASYEECERLVEQATSEGFSPYRGVEPQIDRIGATVFEYDSISKEDYFIRSHDMQKVQDRIFKNSFNPIDRFIYRLREKTGYSVNIASNAKGQSYYAGLIRRIENGTLIHIDFAPAEQVGWEICQVTHQLTWNLYLRTTAGNGGKTHIFNRQWLPEDEQCKEGGYGYSPLIIEGVDSVCFEPSIGEVIIFNTRNFHYVEESAGERVAVTSALGRLQNDDLVLWS